MKNSQSEVSQKHLGVSLGVCVILKYINIVIKQYIVGYYSIL